MDHEIMYENTGISGEIGRNRSSLHTAFDIETSCFIEFSSSVE